MFMNSCRRDYRIIILLGRMGIVGKPSERLWLKENDKESKSKDCGRSNPVALERYSLSRKCVVKGGSRFGILTRVH